jgi:uncharacterized protein (DUF1501 family)
MSLTRRRFLALAGGTTVLATAGGLARFGGQARAADRRRTLVVVELRGGNDGLATVVPDDGRLRDARPTLAADEAALLRPAGLDGASFHPALAPLVGHWEAGRLAVVQGLGFEHPGRSHFECEQHWWDGTTPHEPSPTGWLGRWLDATAPEGEQPPLRGVALGSTAPVLRAARATSTVVLDPLAFTPTTTARALAAVPSVSATDPVVAATQRAIVDAVAAGDTLAAPLSAVAPGERPSLTGDLAVAADLLAADLGIEVLVVGGGGFDTHAEQAPTHAALLADLATGLDALWSSVEASGRAGEVLVVTTSEFGRRVQENGSAGTDHGLAGCQFVLGAARGGVVGAVDLGDLIDGDLRPTVDPRSLFASALRWLGGPVDEVLDGYEDLGIV